MTDITGWVCEFVLLIETRNEILPKSRGQQRLTWTTIHID
jgi:hypothetical protein